MDLLTILAIVYLVFGALIATALFVLDIGVRSRPSEAKDIGKWFVVTLFWFPWIIILILKFIALILLPVKFTNRWIP